MSAAAGEAAALARRNRFLGLVLIAFAAALFLASILFVAAGR